MLRLSRRLLSARCPYDVLGVARNASANDIKSAFNDRVKQTHPDTEAAGTPEQTRQFADLVDAYRVLRDEKKRRQYDLDQANKGRYSQGQGPSYDDRRAGDPATAAEPRSPAEGYAFGALLLGGTVLVCTHISATKAPYKDTENPRRLPRGAQTKQMNNVADSPHAGQQPEVAVKEGMMSEDASPQVADKMIQAFYDPFFERWYKIPEGYEAPAGMDLTAFHHKRTDPVEWSRLYAEGKLTQIIPRGGLQVRFLPTWQTYEPILVGDPFTGKTVSADKIQARVKGQREEKCTVQF